MDVLVLGGTAWLGREIATAALAADHHVTALARGTAPAPEGARLVRSDRTGPAAYDGVVGRAWDLVVDLTRQPGQARSAVAALGDRAARWVLVSSGSVYRPSGQVEADEATPTWDPLPDDEAAPEQYGPGKVGCERAVLDALGERAVVARAGLIGGRGDSSDRVGAYPAAFARAGDAPVLVPAIDDAVVQVVHVADLAAWVVDLGSSTSHGVMDAYGEPIRFADLLALARRAAGHTGEVVRADPDWLLEQGVGHFMGPRSLPFWLPPGHELAVVRPSARARRSGLTWRAYAEMIGEALDDERAAGLDRDRRAGLTRSQEDDLVRAWHRHPA